MSIHSNVVGGLSANIATRHEPSSGEEVAHCPRDELGLSTNIKYPPVLRSVVCSASMPVSRFRKSTILHVANRPRFGCYWQVPMEAYWGLLMPTVISVSTWLPISSVLSACYCL